MIAQRYIKVTQHPEADLFIYNYTASAQFDGVWNEATLQCRGLILDKRGDVVARPFPKFYNLGEEPDQILPREPYEVYEKMDGSLGVLYWIGDDPYVATRGSFTSAQALRATEILHSKYRDAIAKLDRSLTYLFEIIYPENRIVVDYGDEANLTLLAIIDNETGVDQPLQEIGFPLVEQHDVNINIDDLYQLEQDNREGFVIKFRSGFRVKIKFSEYLRIHKIVTGLSTLSVWEALSQGQQLVDILKDVPDEYYQWITDVESEL